MFVIPNALCQVHRQPGSNGAVSASNDLAEAVPRFHTEQSFEFEATRGSRFRTLRYLIVSVLCGLRCLRPHCPTHGWLNSCLHLAFVVQSAEIKDDSAKPLSLVIYRLLL